MLDEKNSRYGIFSIEKLLYGMEELGSNRRNIKARIYGASLLNRKKDSVLKIQESNVEFVEAFLSMARIKIEEKIVFQKEALKIRFEIATGEVTIAKVKRRFF